MPEVIIFSYNRAIQHIVVQLNFYDCVIRSQKSTTDTCSLRIKTF